MSKTPRDLDWTLGASKPEPAESKPSPADLVAFSTRLSSSLKKRLRVFAAKSDRAMADVLHDALTEYLERHEG